MKRIVCPQCENYVNFDETKAEAGKPIILVCSHCRKQFTVRLKTKVNEINTNPYHQVNVSNEDEGYGHITVVENFFGYKQVMPLALGDNVIGRKTKGLHIQVPIVSADPSLGRNHCIIQVKELSDGTLLHSLRDYPSVTGTFWMNKLLGKNERVNLTTGDIITLGATTIIFSQD